MAFGIWAGTYYALVIYPYILDADVKLFLTGSAGAATLFIFGDQVANRTRQDQQTAYTKGQDSGLLTCSFDGQTFPDQASLDQHIITEHSSA